MEELVGWMTANMSSFSAIAFAVTVLSNAIEDAKKIITNKVNIPKVTAIIINKSLLLIAEDKTIFLIKLDITIIQP